MKTCLVLILMEILINDATSVTHSLTSFETSSSQVPNFPEFVAVGVVNGLQVYYYDSKTRRAEPRQDWVDKLAEEDPQFWEMGTQIYLGVEQRNKGAFEIVKQTLNQTEGVHVYQVIGGCEWNDETDEIRGFGQDAFDGEDFISLDWEAETWVAAKPQAIDLQQMWDRTGVAAQIKNFLTHDCVPYLKKFVGYGESSLKRKELPLVSLLQKSSSSPVTCHATGFYPDRAVLFWTKDGEEVSENVDPGEILPNGDGTYQTSVDLDLTSVPSADWDRYNCVFKFSGVTEDLITKLDRAKIRTNEKKHRSMSIIAAVLAVLGLAIFAVVGVFLYRKAKRPSPPPSEAEVQQELNPKI